MHCKSISQVQSGAYSGLKVILVVEHIQRRSADSIWLHQQKMSELLDKQVYVQIEILKIMFMQAHEKVCDENESKKKTTTV